MYSEVNITVEDERAEQISTGTGVQVKIGVSNVTSSEPILITSSMKPTDIKALLGNTPLADACMDATENGLKTIYAIPVTAGTDGTIGEIVHSGSSKGSVSVKGKPNNAYEVIVQITDTGDINEGTFKYSIDGGNSYSDDMTIPLAGIYVLDNTGLTLMFEDITSEEKSFVEDDKYTFRTTAPVMSNAGILDAIEKLKSFNVLFEIAHVVGATTRGLWASLQVVAEEMTFQYKKPFIFICEARACGEDEGINDYIAALRTERKGINSRCVCVVQSYGIYQKRDLRTQQINLAGVITGLLGQAKESLSIGYVKDFPISSAKLIKLLPEGILEYSEVFDEIGYTVFRQYPGLENFYVSNANVFVPAESNFSHVENVRVLNRIIRGVSTQATQNIQAEIDLNDVETGVKAIESELNIPMEDCIADKIISEGEVTIDTENLNILEDEELNVSATWVPMGTIRKYNITFAVRNPYSSEE